MTRPAHLTRPAFTLVELLMVIGIIAILLVIALVVGGRVAGSGKERATEQTLRILDQSLSAFLSQSQSPLPSLYRDEQGGSEFSILDAREDGADPASAAIPSLARYTAAVREAPSVDAMLKGIDAKFIREVSLGIPDAGGPDPLIRSVEVLDGFARPIRIVHPAFHGGYGDFWNGSGLTSRPPLTVGPRDYSRSYRPFNPAAAGPGAVGDADEGLCTANRPYFYSAGADGDPGTRKDNLYSTRPNFPSETAKLAD